MSTKDFTIDEDTYNITFSFLGNDSKKYKIVINASYECDDWIELYVIDDNDEQLLNKFTNKGMDSLWEYLYENHTQKILVAICNLVKAFMEVKDSK